MAEPEQKQVVAKPADGEKRHTQAKKKTRFPILCPGHSRPVHDVSFSCRVDERVFMASACLDASAMLRDGKTGDWLGTFQGHGGAVWTCRLNEDATRALTASADYTSRLWDAVTGDQIASFEHANVVKSAVFSADEKQIFTVGYEKKLRAFDSTSNKVVWSIAVETAGDPLSHIAAVGEHYLITASEEDHLKVWDVRTCAEVKKLKTGSPINHVNFPANGSTHGHIVAVTNRALHLWNISDGFASVLNTKISIGALNCGAYHHESKRFAIASNKEMGVRIYDASSGKELARNKGHHGPVHCIAFSPDGTYFASGADDATVRMWSCPKPGAVGLKKERHRRKRSKRRSRSREA